MGLAGESARADVKSSIFRMASAKESPDFWSAHCALTVLYFDYNPRRLKAKSVLRCYDILSAVWACGRDKRSVSKRAKQRGYHFLHFVPIQRKQSIFNPLDGLLMEIFQRVSMDLSVVVFDGVAVFAGLIRWSATLGNLIKLADRLSFNEEQC